MYIIKLFYDTYVTTTTRLEELGICSPFPFEFRHKYKKICKYQENNDALQEKFVPDSFSGPTSNYNSTCSAGNWKKISSKFKAQMKIIMLSFHCSVIDLHCL